MWMFIEGKENDIKRTPSEYHYFTLSDFCQAVVSVFDLPASRREDQALRGHIDMHDF
jgi:hypothetical protein